MISIEVAYVHSIETRAVQFQDRAPKDMASLRVLVDRSYPDGQNEDGSNRYNDSRNFWISVQIWGRRARSLQGIVLQNARILMTGRYVNNRWTDSETGEEKERMVFEASRIALLPESVEQVTYRRKSADAPREDSEADDMPIQER